MDAFVVARFVAYAVVVAALAFIVLWFEATPGNGGKSRLRLLLYPSLVTWLMIFVSTGLKLAGSNENAPYLFFAAAIYTVVSLATFMCRG